MLEDAESSLDLDKTRAPPGTLEQLSNEDHRKWTITFLRPYGRCIVASADIAQGEVLFSNSPLITGPKLTSDFICLGCYSSLEQQPTYRCTRCQWPVCNRECEEKGYHPLECEVLSRATHDLNLDDFGKENPLYESILPLRCLRLKERDGAKWATLMAMESHDDLRRGTQQWNYEQSNVCNFLRDNYAVSFDDALMHRICGVLEVNCHEVRSRMPGSSGESRVRGVYPLCAMISHSCTSNTLHTVTDDHTMLMVASTDIAKGNQVTGIYTHLLSGTTERRKHLRYGKFFDCVCRRCSDPTELGTFFSALRCTRPGCDGDVLCKDPLHPLNKADYACNKCGHEVESAMVEYLTSRIGQEIEAAGERNTTELEDIMSKYSPLLHPNHYHVTALKCSLSQMYGRVSNFSMGDLPEDQLDRKIQCCQDLLSILDIIDPGISRLRGVTNYELHASLLLRLNRKFEQKLLTKEEYLERLQYVLLLLSDSVECLQFESSASFEGKICKIAKGSCLELQKRICTAERLAETSFLPSTSVEFETSNLAEQDLTLEALLMKLEES